MAKWGDTKGMPGYQLSKSAGTCAMQQVARAVDLARMQVVSMHPGIVFTGAAAGAGYTRDTLPWNHVTVLHPLGRIPSPEQHSIIYAERERERDREGWVLTSAAR